MSDIETHEFELHNSIDLAHTSGGATVIASLRHHNARMLRINTKTGDVLSQLFFNAEDPKRNELIDKTAHGSVLTEVFSEQAGEIVNIVIATSYNALPFKAYEAYLQGIGLKLDELIVIDMTKFSEFEQYKFGEIPVSVAIQLNDLSKVRASINGEDSFDIFTGLLVSVFNQEASMPPLSPIIKERQRLFKYATAIAMAYVGVLQKAQTTTSEINQPYNQNKDVLLNTLITMEPFSEDMLYDDGCVSRIVKTLQLLNTPKTPDELIVIATNEALRQTTNKTRLRSIKGQPSTEFRQHTEELMKFAEQITQTKASQPQTQNTKELVFELVLARMGIDEDDASEPHVIKRVKSWLYALAPKLVEDLATSNTLKQNKLNA